MVCALMGPGDCLSTSVRNACPGLCNNPCPFGITMPPSIDTTVVALGVTADKIRAPVGSVPCTDAIVSAGQGLADLNWAVEDLRRAAHTVRPAEPKDACHVTAEAQRDQPYSPVGEQLGKRREETRPNMYLAGGRK